MKLIAALLLAALSAVPARASDPPALPLPPIEYDPERVPKFDWVQIDSGEWLKGEIDRVERDELYFDSDEFGDVEFDWDDVITLVSSDPVSVRVEDEDRDTIIGRIDMRGDVIRLHTDAGVREVPKDQVVRIVPGTLTELDFWSFSATLSASSRAGNTDQNDISLRTDLVRQTALTRWSTRYSGEVSTVDGTETANSHRASTEFSVYLTRRFFVTAPTLELFTDEFQNIDSRITLSGGLGYELVDNSWLLWAIDAGLGYQRVNYASVELGEAEGDDDVVVSAGVIVNFDLPYGIDWENEYELQAIVTDLDKTSHHARSTIELDIWGPLDLEVAFIFDRIEKPEPESDGDQPESNDYRTTVGLGLDF